LNPRRKPDQFHVADMAVKQSLSVLQPMGLRRFRSVWRVAVSSFAPSVVVGNSCNDCTVFYQSEINNESVALPTL